ncbi:MAG: hypothetical protein EH225_13385 [Calditrichaeota bacterium]|nr:hypothetical protein [Calditrichota bacterium]RQV98384.1 MAG: hypothetical protein EH225_13385 [Calditrichota bacterium]
MSRIISIHEYSLKPGVSVNSFEKSISSARERGILKLPGLENYSLMKGIRGARRNQYAALWIYRDLSSWEKLWGPLDNPFKKEKYPENWKKWENEIIGPYLTGDPDKISFTSYQEL